MKSLENKSILITGGTKGIGYGIAEALLNQGCKVAITGRKKEEAEEAAKKLSSKTDGNAIGLQADVRSLDDMKRVSKAVEDEFGGIDVVVGNAGVGLFGSIEELEPKDWQTMIDTNLTGLYNTIKATVALLKASKGYYLTISSLAGTNFFEGGSGYNASKFGAVGFTQAVMLDLRQSDIKVSTIMPGSVMSHFAGHTPDEKDAWKIQPADIGELVIDLLKMNPRALPSKIEIRPSKPPKR